jgi:hypothetical protein
MHRSGTSALARILGFCGGALPRRVIEPSAEVNETGFWEPREIVALHDEVFGAAGSFWHDLRSFPDSWFRSAEASVFRDRLRALFVEEFGTAPLPVLKDPRLCRLLPLWRPILAGLGLAPLAVIPIRNPLEVAASIARRDGFGEGKALLLWLVHFLAAERQSRDMPRCFVAYDRLLADGPGTVDRIGAALGIAWPRPPAAAADEIGGFLALRLRHHVVDDEAWRARPDVPAPVAEAYRWALAAAAGEAPPVEALDRIGDELRRAEAAFGPALLALETYGREQRDAVLHWAGIAVQRYEVIEQLRGAIAALQAGAGDSSPK